MKTLFVLLGPTGVGKTALSLKLANVLKSPVLNADSRQIYQGIPIGTAAPTASDLARVQHYFVGTMELDAYYSAARYEADVLDLTSHLFLSHDNLLLSGGSMLYIDAVCRGIDALPTVRAEIRQTVNLQYERSGLEPLVKALQELDPVYCETADLKNTRRVLHALEICRQTGRPYSSFLTAKTAERPFRIIKIGLTRPREELFDRIGRRVDQMVADGLVDEARRVYPLRHLNSLHTVGYNELFQYFAGDRSLSETIEKIKRNTRVYAKKQMTWFSRDPSIFWFRADKEKAMLHFVADMTSK